MIGVAPRTKVRELWGQDEGNGESSWIVPLVSLRNVIDAYCLPIADEAFVRLQNEHVAWGGGLRIFNALDPIPSCGYGLVAVAAAAGVATAVGSVHGGHGLELRNSLLTQVNPYANHLTYCSTSFELFPGHPDLRARYIFPGVAYAPDKNPTRIAPTPRLVLDGSKPG